MYVVFKVYAKVMITKLVIKVLIHFVSVGFLLNVQCRDEDKIMQACYWSHEVYEPCFGGCAEVSCDNPRNHLRPCYPYCEPGCVCEEPYVRDDRTHQCVLPQDCSPTQMGIPVPNKRSGKTIAPKYVNTNTRSRKHSDVVEYVDNEGPTNIHPEESKRESGISRMGNYFNIVIAPPPIKALQPRKMLINDGLRVSSKRL